MHRYSAEKEIRRLRSGLVRLFAVFPLAVMFVIFGSGSSAFACNTTPQWNNTSGVGMHAPPTNQWDDDRNWSSAMMTGFYQATGNWAKTSTHAPYFVDNFSANGNGKLWFQSTSACAGNWVGCTYSWSNSSTGLISFSDVTINSSYSYGWGNNPLTWTKPDFLADMTHEMGHAQGLDHNSDYNSSIMYPVIDNAPTTHENPLCGDQARMKLIYGN